MKLIYQFSIIRLYLSVIRRMTNENPHIMYSTEKN